MYEYIGQALLSVDFLGMGIAIALVALCLGISYNLSNGDTGTFLMIMIITSYSIGALMLWSFQEGEMLILTTAFLVAILILPDGTAERLFKKEV